MEGFEGRAGYRLTNVTQDMSKTGSKSVYASNGNRITI